MLLQTLATVFALLCCAYAAPFAEVSAAGTCDSALFQKCGAAYAKNLGLSSLPSNPMDFLTFLQKTYTTEGVSGFSKVCRAGMELKRCLGSQYTACISVENLVKMGLSVQDATIYVTISDQLGFQCGPAYQIYINNFNCLMSASKTENATLGACLDTYQHNMVKDPANACKYTQDFVTCYTAPFEKDCGGAVGWAICGSMKVAFAHTMPQCKISCSTEDDVAANNDVHRAGMIGLMPNMARLFSLN